MRKINVLNIAEDLKMGGLERILATIVTGLDRNKFKVGVWCLKKGGDIADELIKRGIELKILGMENYNLPNILKLIRELRREKIDILHIHGFTPGIIAAIPAKLAGIPAVVVHFHSMHWELKPKRLLFKKFLSLFMNKIICCSEAVKKFVIEHEGIASHKTVVIYNGIDAAAFEKKTDKRKIKREFGISQESPIVGTVATLSSHKGYDYLLDCVPEVFKVFPDVKFLLVGEGVDRKKLENQVQRLNISSSVIFTGKLKSISEVLSIMDVFVLASTFREGLGNSVLEAMACAKPTIVTNVGGLPELVQNGTNGIVVPPKDSDSLSKAIISLLEKREKASEMGLKGREIFKKKFTSKIMLDSLEKLYLSL